MTASNGMVWIDMDIHGLFEHQELDAHRPMKEQLSKYLHFLNYPCSKKETRVNRSIGADLREGNWMVQVEHDQNHEG
jgi:hypothetical protein